MYTREETKKLRRIYYGLLFFVGIKACGIFTPDVLLGVKHAFLGWTGADKNGETKPGM